MRRTDSPHPGSLPADGGSARDRILARLKAAQAGALSDAGGRRVVRPRTAMNPRPNARRFQANMEAARAEVYRVNDGNWVESCGKFSPPKG